MPYLKKTKQKKIAFKKKLYILLTFWKSIVQFSCFCLVHLFCTNLGHMTKCIFPCLVQFAFLQCIVTKIIQVLWRIPLVQFVVEFLVQITLHCFGVDQQDPEPFSNMETGNTIAPYCTDLLCTLEDQTVTKLKNSNCAKLKKN